MAVDLPLSGASAIFDGRIRQRGTALGYNFTAKWHIAFACGEQYPSDLVIAERQQDAERSTQAVGAFETRISEYLHSKITININ